MKTEVDGKRRNLMLFHSTSRSGVRGILDEGSKHTDEGWFGSGVYMSECSSIAFSYSHKHSYNSKKCSNFIFVNEVIATEKLQTFEFDISDVKNHNTPLKNPFNKHIGKLSTQLTQKDYNEDGDGRRYRNIAVDSSSMFDEFVAKASVTIPRYLILVETKK